MDAQTFKAMVAAPVVTPGVIEQWCIETETLDGVLLAVTKLPPVEALLIVLWFGLHGGEHWTIQRLAKRFGLSRARIGELRDQGLKRLRMRYGTHR